MKKIIIIKEALVGGTGYSPKDVLEVEQEVLDRLEPLGLAREYDEKRDGQVKSSDNDTSELEGQIETLGQENEALNSKVSELEGQIEASDKEVEAEITRLKGLIEEAIVLPKGTRPENYPEES